MSIFFKKRTTASVPTPASGKVALFIDSADGITKTKDETGTVVNLVPASYSDEQAQDAVGNALVDTNTIDFTYDDAGNAISAVMRIKVAADFIGASKTFVKADHGLYQRMSNGGSAMTVTLPTLTTADDGWWVKVDNIDTVIAATITFTDGAGSQFGTSTATSYVLQYGCRQTFVWTGSRWTFDAGNGNLTKTPVAGTVAAGELPKWLDSTGRALTSSGVQASTVALNTRLINTTAPLTGGGDLTADRTLAISPATTTTAGSMSATDKTKLNGLVTGLNGWIDVTQQTANPVNPGNSAAVNVTNLNAILAAAPSGSTIYFPGGTYSFNATITIPAKAFNFVGQGQNLTGGYTLLVWTANIGGNLMQLTSGNWYSTFQYLIFTCTVSQTAGAALALNSNVSTHIKNCSFQGFSSSQTLYNCIDFTGTNAAENTVIDTVDCSSFTNYGININGVLCSPTIVNTVIQGLWGTSTQAAAAGLVIQNAGAVQVDNSDIIGCVNNILINPATSIVVASVYITNTYLDNALGSCLKITGAGATVRCRFIAVSFTTSNASTGFSGIEISSTNAAGAQGIDFENCSILNTFGTTGTTYGFLITGAADFSIIACRVAGWTNGVSITPAGANGVTKPFLADNTIGPTGGYGGNTVGIALNAGSFQYGNVMLCDNQLAGNTTPITDAATFASSGQRIVTNNGGSVTPLSASATAVVFPTTTITSIDPRGGIFIPANVRPGTCGRITFMASCTAVANTITMSVRLGTANTNADTAVWSQALTGGTAAAGSGKFVIDWQFLTSTTIAIQMSFTNGNSAATGLIALAASGGGLATPATITTTANQWLGVYLSCNTASTVTVRNVIYEVTSQ